MKVSEYESIPESETLGLSSRFPRIVSFVLIVLAVFVVFFAGRNDNSTTVVKGEYNEKYASDMVKIAKPVEVTEESEPTLTPTTMKPQLPTRRPKASPTFTNKPVFKAGSNPYPTLFVSCSDYTTNYGCSEDKAVLCYCDDDSRCCADTDGECSSSKVWHTWLASNNFCKLS